MSNLVNISEYDTNNMIFEAPVIGAVAGNASLKYQRVNIKTKNNDGTVGDLIFVTPRLFSFGVQVNKSPETKKITGFALPLCMWDKDSPKDEELLVTQFIDDVIERTKKWLVENRLKIGKPDLEISDLKKFNPLFYKRDPQSGQVLEGRGPVLYPKLIGYKKKGESEDAPFTFISKFYIDNVETDPYDLVGNMLWTTCAIKIESVFINGRGCNIQIKVMESDVEVVNKERSRLLNTTVRKTYDESKESGELRYTPKSEPEPLPSQSAAQSEPETRKVPVSRRRA